MLVILLAVSFKISSRSATASATSKSWGGQCMRDYTSWAGATQTPDHCCMLWAEEMHQQLSIGTANLLNMSARASSALPAHASGQAAHSLIAGLCWSHSRCHHPQPAVNTVNVNNMFVYEHLWAEELRSNAATLW